MIVIALLSAWANAAAETIAEVVKRSNAQYMASLKFVDVSAAPETVKSFQKVIAYLKADRLIYLRIVDGNTTGITDGNTVVLHRSNETNDEIMREFVIAHECGHILKKHTLQKIALYEKYIPGEVTEEAANRANNIVGPEMRRLSYRVEFEADEFALRTLVGLGRTRDEVIGAFMAIERTTDTATHPSTAKRIMALRSVVF